MRDKLYISFLPLRQKSLIANLGTYTLTGSSVGLTYFAIEPEVSTYLGAISVPNDGTIYYSGTAYEITGAEIWTALDTCVKGIKTAISLSLGTNNLSTKFKYIYPRIGGTSTAHRYNLVTGTADGTYNGGFTHDGSGTIGNGSTGYFDTGFGYTSTNFSQNSQSFGVWIKTALTENNTDIGLFSGGFADMIIQGRRGAGVLLSRLGGNSGNVSNANTTSLGFKVISRESSSQYKVYEDGSLLATNTDGSSGFNATSYNICEFALNTQNVISLYSNHKHTWHYGGLGFSATEVGNIYTALNTFETTLNR